MPPGRTQSRDRAPSPKASWITSRSTTAPNTHPIQEKPSAVRCSTSSFRRELPITTRSNPTSQPTARVLTTLSQKRPWKPAPGARLLYVGDTAKKNLYVDRDGLAELGISITDHGKLPDVVFYDAERNWLFLVEAVTSHGPMSPTRIVDLENMLSECSSGAVYVSAFPDFGEFRKHMKNIAWETEVWLCDTPDHMIHYDGDRFLGPRQ